MAMTDFVPLMRLVATQKASDIDGEMHVHEEHGEEGMLIRLRRAQDGSCTCGGCVDEPPRSCRADCTSKRLRLMTEIAFMKLESVYGESIVTERGDPVLHPLSHPKGQLFAAASFGLSHATHCLIASGEVGINAAIGNMGGTAIAVASRDGHLRCVRTLLDLGAEVNALPCHACDGRTRNTIAPLVSAVFSRDPLCVRMLLDAGADVNGGSRVHGAFTGPALVAASVTGCIAIVRVLLQEEGIDVAAVGSMGHGAATCESFTSLEFARMNLLKNPAEDMSQIVELLEAHLPTTDRPVRTGGGSHVSDVDESDNIDNNDDDGDDDDHDDEDEDDMLEVVRALEAGVHAIESGPGVDDGGEELASAMARLRKASEAVFRKLQYIFSDVVMCPASESMLGISTPEGRLYFAATRELTYTMRDLIASGVVGVNAPISSKVRSFERSANEPAHINPSFIGSRWVLWIPPHILVIHLRLRHARPTWTLTRASNCFQLYHSFRAGML